MEVNDLQGGSPTYVRAPRAWDPHISGRVPPAVTAEEPLDERPFV